MNQEAQRMLKADLKRKAKAEGKHPAVDEEEMKESSTDEEFGMIRPKTTGDLFKSFKKEQSHIL